ncbi:ABC transporter related protein [Xylanimonas cellulosilytica DSM 15894]|uniref:ABC transporter related protein n=1 Tax=Xylanimonas cellulosilytica (strain DSM 15894 / JCM 12276 / CECT 5975 / KCTC 9989 / LMG 20990 / NBRC 107835 / XIL07) TaxID=446471 RepID=D1BWR6_XYLCX|nr:ABC transporter ATP-binding protein [Xylanimonas cellulosilytica]ACZ29648.1 ABC transporter related protein [Xylanimonas cellulosilytica DSM 15894]
METTTLRAPDPARARTTAAVRVRDLRKRYGTHQALDGVELDVERGEIFAVLGPNGAGKTTTVEILAGFRSRDDGEVSVLGQDPATAGRAWRAGLGVVLQDARDLSELTVAETVRATARYYPAPRDPAEVIAAVGLQEKAGKRVRTLSGGQRRRLDVALGIVGRPELLFLDEPTTGFDPEARHAFWDLVRSLRDGGTTVLLTTHYLDEAAHLADRAAVISAGRVVALGTPESLGGPQARIPVVRWVEDGQPRSERSTTPTALVAQLAATAGPGREVDGLTVTRPSLEDVYLDLIHDRTEESR